MSILKLTETLYIAPQLQEADIAQATQLGIRSVICNRPDHEEEQQPDFAQVNEWLNAAGIHDTKQQAVVASSITAADVTEFQNLLAQLPQPTLAYCRTGTRCSLLWAYHQVQNGMSVEQAMATAQNAGVNLANFESRLHATAESGLA